MTRRAKNATRHQLSHLFVVLVLLAVGRSVAASQMKNVQAPANAGMAGAREYQGYCGVACLYVAMRLADQEIEFRNLVTGRYIGSRKGSSTGELKTAAEDHGMHATEIANIASHDLRALSDPAILHAKTSDDSKEYDHYVLFLGIIGDQAIVFDPPSAVTVVPLYRLSQRCDGNGLIVSDRPIDTTAIIAAARKRLFLRTGVCVVIVITLRWVRKRWALGPTCVPRFRRVKRSVLEGAALAMVGGVGGLFWHCAHDEGFLAHAGATEGIVRAYLTSFLDEVDVGEIPGLLENDTVFVDARFPRSFEAGHLGEAINVPTFFGEEGRKKAMSGVPKNARIVVYCQSARCRFSEKVALKLIDDGYSNLTLFRGGWNEWAKSKGLKAESTSECGS